MNVIEEKLNWIFDNDTRLVLFVFGTVIVMFSVMGVTWHNNYQEDLANSYTFQATIIKYDEGCLVETSTEERFSIWRGNCANYIVGDIVTVKSFDKRYTIEGRHD